MRVVMFYHSVVSDWNHGNAHFLRGVATEMLARGFDVQIYEPRDAWSVENLVKEYGEKPIADFHAAYPNLKSIRYNLETLDLDEILRGAELVIVHEWNDHKLVEQIGEHRVRSGSYRLLFHDTHHRAVTDRKSMAAYNLENYDGVLAFGKVIRDLYLRENWTRRAWTWHEAADTRVFYPRAKNKELPDFDLIWIGNWGDEERTAELHEFLLEPVKKLKLRARVHGVRYPKSALKALKNAGIEYAGWLPNFAAPAAFAQAKVTIHVPRRPYVESLPGIPTIRPFEALACRIPLVSSHWEDTENLFALGKDFLVARNGEEMKNHLKQLLENEDLRWQLAEHGLRTIRQRHTCAHRVNELMKIYVELENSKQEKEMTA